MRLLTLLAAGLFAAPLMAADDKKDERKAKDEEAILGTWEVERIDAGGDVTPDLIKATERERLTFAKDGEASTGGPDGKAVEGVYKLDPSAKPRAVDMRFGGGDPIPAVYELDGDTLKICLRVVTSGEKPVRPGGVKLGGKEEVVLTLKRVTDEKKDK
jgi:uncharacterized protein (TIGR03067 family)